MMKMVVTVKIHNNIFLEFFKGLSPLQTKKLESKSCSERICYYTNALQYSTWISSKVRKIDYELYSPSLFQFYPKVLPGCDCCVVDGKLVPDGESWIQGGKVYGNFKSF